MRHDWGGQLSWLLAARHPDRLLSLTVLSRPHPAAFARSFQNDAEQAHRSRHHRAFQNPNTADRMLEDGARRLKRALRDQGVPEPDIDAYTKPLSQRAALDAALNWYRAAPGSDSALLGPNVPAVDTPTLFLWGDADATVGRAAADATADFVNGPYRFEVIPGAGHFLTDQAPKTVTRHLLAHLANVGPV